MRVYLVNAGDDYYPSWDNTKFVTTDRERAEKSAKKLSESGRYDWVDVCSKGVDK